MCYVHVTAVVACTLEVGASIISMHVGISAKCGLVPMSTELKFRRNVFFFPSQRIFVFRRNVFSFPFVRVCNSVYAGFDNRFSVN
jgi:hypothetical protein